jgi:hypothetical protein
MTASVIDEIVRSEGAAQPLLWMAAGAMIAGVLVLALAGLGALAAHVWRSMRPAPDEDTAGTAHWLLAPDDEAGW